LDSALRQKKADLSARDDIFSDFPRSEVKNARLKSSRPLQIQRQSQRLRLRAFFPQAAKAKLTGQVRWPPEIN
jgi:hypothetical protein